MVAKSQTKSLRRWFGVGVITGLLLTADLAAGQSPVAIPWARRTADQSVTSEIADGFIADDGYWDDRFTGHPGVNDFVNAIAIAGEDVFVGGRFSYAAASTLRTRGVAQWDGTKWHDLGGGLTNGNGVGDADALAFSNGLLYAGGQFNIAGTTEVNNIAMWDGSTWHPLGSGVEVPNSNAWVSAIETIGDSVYVGGRFSLAGGNPASFIALWDGSQWSAMGDSIDHWIEDIAIDGDRIVSVGYRNLQFEARSRLVAEWDGSEWVSLADSVKYGNKSGRIDAVTILDGDVYVGGLFDEIEGVEANSVARWDGEAWHPVGDGVNSNIWRLEAREGEVVAGGLFVSAGGVVVNKIAAWDGVQWSSLDTGVAGRSNFGARVDGLAVDGERVFAGGRFEVAGSAIALNIAEWDGQEWSALGDETGLGLTGPVNSMEVGSDGLYVGGQFLVAGNLMANSVARWDGTKWDSLGAGVDGDVWSLLSDETDVFVGGRFFRAGGLETNHLARWDGSQWHAFGMESDTTGFRLLRVWSMTMFRGDLHVGGRFWSDAGGEVKYLMRWDGSRWQSLGGGVDGSGGVRIEALVVHDSVLYVGGDMNQAGELPVNSIAGWDGESWFDVGGGLTYDSGRNGSVLAIVSQAQNLFVAGGFSRAGTEPVRNIAQWDGQGWHALAEGANGPVEDLAEVGERLYMVGRFDEPAKSVSKWNGTDWQSLGGGVWPRTRAVTGYEGDVYVGGSFTAAVGVLSHRIARWHESTETGTTVALPTTLSVDITGVYPNPFSDETTIQLQLGTSTAVRITIFDALGREVQRLIDDRPYPAGRHDIRFSAAALSPGMYVGRVVAGSSVESIRLVVVR